MGIMISSYFLVLAVVLLLALLVLFEAAVEGQRHLPRPSAHPVSSQENGGKP